MEPRVLSAVVQKIEHEQSEWGQRHTVHIETRRDMNASLVMGGVGAPFVRVALPFRTFDETSAFRVGESYSIRIEKVSE